MISRDTHFYQGLGYFGISAIVLQPDFAFEINVYHASPTQRHQLVATLNFIEYGCHLDLTLGWWA